MGELAQKNRVLDTAYECVLRALMTPGERIGAVVFVASQGLAVTPGLSFLPTPAWYVALGTLDDTDTPPFIREGTDKRRNKGVWTAVGTPTTNVTYDTLGLLMTSGLIFAATQFESRTALADTPVSVQWEITLEATNG
jgi:hypothetical protein